MGIQLFFAFVLIVARTVTCGRDATVCDVVTESCGAIPPPLPRNFEMKSEHMDWAQKSLYWEEMYFDSDNLRGKYVFLTKGIEHHLIFDYNTSQVIVYDVLHPGASMKRDPLSEACVSENMDYFPLNYIFGYKGGNLQMKHSRMYDSYEVLRFGSQYRYRFNGSEELKDRGVKANMFYGCIYDSSADVTAAMSYYFSGQYIVPAAGTMEFIVDGAENGAFLSVPLKCEYRGTHYFFNSNNEKKDEKFDSLQSISWFKGNPVFDNTKFQIPLGLYCKDYRGWKRMPKLPQAFSTDLEITGFTQDMDGKTLAAALYSFSQIWYNYDKGLARRDYTPVPESDTEIYSKFQNYAPVKTIYDFSVGVLYVINKPSGRCFTRSIDVNDFFETTAERTFIEMATPEELFYMHTDEMEYKGQYYTRNVLCDVWSGKDYNKRTDSNFFKETFISTNGYHSDVEDKVQYGFPVKHTTIVNSTVDGEYQQGILERNFFKFKATPPPLAVFDITGCIDHLEHRFFAIVVNIAGEDQDVIYRYRRQFQAQMQEYIAQVSQVISPLRVQQVQLQKVNKYDIVTFALVGKINKVQILFVQKGANLSEAENNLAKFVDAGNFALKFKTPLPNDDLKEIIVIPGNIFKVKNGKLTYADISTKKVHVKSEQVTTIAIPYKVKPKVKKGMSPGGLAALAIAMLLIGIAIGVSGMYYYIRKFSFQGVQDQYAMQNST